MELQLEGKRSLVTGSSALDMMEALKATLLTDIHQIAAGSFANLPRFRVLGNPAPLARAVDGDGTSRRHAER